jgi:hypothetical protein
LVLRQPLNFDVGKVGAVLQLGLLLRLDRRRLAPVAGQHRREPVLGDYGEILHPEEAELPPAVGLPRPVVQARRHGGLRVPGEDVDAAAYPAVVGALVERASRCQLEPEEVGATLGAYLGGGVGRGEAGQ